MINVTCTDVFQKLSNFKWQQNTPKQFKFMKLENNVLKIFVIGVVLGTRDCKYIATSEDSGYLDFEYYGVHQARIYTYVGEKLTAIEYCLTDKQSYKQYLEDYNLHNNTELKQIEIYSLKTMVGKHNYK